MQPRAYRRTSWSLTALLALILAGGLASARANDEHFVIAFGAEPTQLDPTRTSAGVDAYFMSLFYETLLAIDPDLDQINWLAEDWRIEERDGLPVIFVKLREGVMFHDGTELTATDLAFAYERTSDPISRTAGRLRYVDRVDVLDRYRFEMVLNAPDAALIPGNLVLTAISAAHFAREGDEGVNLRPMGTGPYRFISRKPREELVIERFDDYWRDGPGNRPKRITIKIIPEDTTRVAAFKTGAVDWMDAVPPAQIESFKSLPGVRMASRPAPNNMYININAEQPRHPLSNVKVRQAIAHAIDFDAIIEYILYKQGIRTAQLAPGSTGYDPTLEPYPYDPDRARALLAEAGYARGINVPCYNLTTPREPYMKEMGEAMFAYMGVIGIRCRIVQLEYGAWINLARVGVRPYMDGILSTMWGQGLPGNPTEAWGGHVHSSGDGWGTYSYHKDPELDAMIEEIRTTMDQTRHVELIQQVARIRHERVAGGIPTYRPLITFAWRDTIDFNPWPQAFWRSMLEIGPAGKGGSAKGVPSESGSAGRATAARALAATSGTAE
ncbi:MAG: glutathione ABC transporter substrate-binding protein [Gammaproteobacteria bacterium]|nr:glutathione ABC transporter substrate-binding protein [Gammaproteobacteria bacterium]